MIKRRLKNTASFLCADYLISVYGSVVVCAPAIRSVGYGSVKSVVLPPCRIGSEENGCGIFCECDVMMWDILLT